MSWVAKLNKVSLNNSAGFLTHVIGMQAEVRANLSKEKRLFLFQETFDHDKGQKFVISGRRLHCFFFSWFSRFYVQFNSLVRKAPLNVEKIARFPGGEKCVRSCHISGCHGFFGPDFWLFLDFEPFESCFFGRCNSRERVLRLIVAKLQSDKKSECKLSNG